MQNITMTKNNKAFSLVEISIVIIIIGIIIVGIAKGSAFYEKTQMKIAQRITENSPPMFLDDLSLWLELSRDSSVKLREDGVKVDLWNSYTDYNATQSNDSLKPVYKKNFFQNGMPALDFTAGQRLEVDSSTYTESDFTIFAVVKPAPYVGGNHFIVSGPQLGIERFGKFHVRNPGGYYSRVESNCWDGGVKRDQEFIISATLTVGKSTVLRFNGSKGYNGAYSSNCHGGVNPDNVLAFAATETPLYVGGKDVSYDGRWRGYIAELIIFKRALSNKERKSVEKYLSQKFGIEL